MTTDPRLTQYRRRLDQIAAARDQAVRRCHAAENRLDQTRQLLADREAARAVLQGLAADLQRSAQKQISDVVTACLKAVFGDDAYTFRIDLVERRGKTEADLYLCRGGKDYSPLESCGGGVSDVCSFALRLACLILSKPARRKLLCLDEPFRHLSSHYAGRVRAMLDRLCEDLGLQAVLVTHSAALAGDDAVRLG